MPHLSSLVARPRLVAAAVLVVVTALAAVMLQAVASASFGATPHAESSAGTSDTPSKLPFVASLDTRGVTAAQESAAGVKMAMLELNWRAFEPKPNQFDANYAKARVKDLARLRAAGMQVTLGLGLQYTPDWVLSRPGSRYVDEYGNQSEKFDLVFSQAARRSVFAYLQQVATQIGFGGIYAVRIASGGDSELVYPTTHFWAYSSGAQNGADAPPSLAPNPLPGYKPGDAGPTTEQVTNWVSWYLGALSNVADWQMSVLRNAGFTGYLQVVTPGLGALPRQMPRYIANLGDGQIGRGAVWNQVYGQLQHRNKVIAYVSSVADGSGNDSGCSVNDGTVGITDAVINTWSATRWIAYVARRNGLAVSGENPGYPMSGKQPAKTHYSDDGSNGLMARAANQAMTCGFTGLYWAHDDQFWNGTSSLSQFASYAG